jgi:diphthamide synthase subunit DPH2
MEQQRVQQLAQLVQQDLQALPDQKVILVQPEQKVKQVRQVQRELEVLDQRVTPEHKDLRDLKVMLEVLGQ